MSILLEDNKEEEILKNSDITYEYIAGVFDADGDIKIRHHTNRPSIRIDISISNADIELLRDINNKLDNIGTFIVDRKDIKYPNCNISYRLQFSGKKGLIIANKIYKFCRHKKKCERMRLVLKNKELFHNNGKAYTPEQRKKQKEIVEQSRKMIFRGRGAYSREDQLIRYKKKTIFNYTNDFEKIGLVPYKVEELT